MSVTFSNSSTSGAKPSSHARARSLSPRSSALLQDLADDFLGPGGSELGDEGCGEMEVKIREMEARLSHFVDRGLRRDVGLRIRHAQPARMEFRKST